MELLLVKNYVLNFMSNIHIICFKQVVEHNLEEVIARSSKDIDQYDIESHSLIPDSRNYLMLETSFNHILIITPLRALDIARVAVCNVD